MESSQSRPNLDISTTQGMITSSELRANVEGVADQLKNTQQPVVITIKGRPGFVAISTELFETMKRATLRDLTDGH